MSVGQRDVCEQTDAIDERLRGVFSYIAAWQAGARDTKHPDVCWRLIDRLLDQRLDLRETCCES